MKTMDRILPLAIAAFLAAPAAHAAPTKTAPLSKVVSYYLTPPGELPEWSAGSEEPAIQWTTSGVDLAPGREPGGKRSGKARVTVAGKELTNLRQRLEPVAWNITMSSTSPIKFGVEKIELHPVCDTVACEFDFSQAMAGSGIALSHICTAGPSVYRQAAYLATKGGKQAVLVYDTNSGSGGQSNSLTIFPGTNAEQTDWCADARSMQN